MRKKKGKGAKRLIWCVLIGIMILGSVWIIKSREITFQKRSYLENNKSIITPNRGLYFQIDSGQWESLNGYYEDEFRVVLLAYDLSEEKNQDQISIEKIEELRNGLEYARKIHMGVVFRGAYDFIGNYEDPNTFQSILSHVEQIATVLNEYKDVIMGVQAGFLGPYGEWHSSDYVEYNGAGESYRVKLLRKMVDCFDEDIVINLRRPMFIREAQEAGLPIERFGYHDDALLSTDTDMGTYVDEDYSREDELAWVSEHIVTPINGGEMTNISEYTQVENVIKEFNQLQITYLNRYYNVEVLEEWKQKEYQGENAYEYIIKHLGYRLSLQEVTYQESLRPHKNFVLSGIIRNSGFARMQKGCQFFLVIKNKDSYHYEPIESSQKGKETIVFNGIVLLEELLETIQDGDRIEVGLAISDHEIKSENCMIELANDQINYKQGANFFATYQYENQKFWLQDE